MPLTKQSAGLLLFRRLEKEIEFLLVHPGGPFFARKHEGVWTIPKGELKENEDPLEAAKREFKEETGFAMEGQFLPLHPIKQKGGKQVLGWALEANLDETKIESNTFELQWPPRSGRLQQFPEIDKAGWFGYEEACRLINERQIPFIDELLRLISS